MMSDREKRVKPSYVRTYDENAESKCSFSACSSSPPRRLFSLYVVMSLKRSWNVFSFGACLHHSSTLPMHPCSAVWLPSL